MEIRIIDTTLRDGEQSPGIALDCQEKLKISILLAGLGIYQIEAGTPAMGGQEKKSIEKIVELNLKSKISTWNRMNIEDIKHAVDCGADIIHISVPASDMQIYTKLKKDKTWVLNQMVRCIYFAREKGFTVHIGLEDASRADLSFLTELGTRAVCEGARMIRYADTVGVLHPQRIYRELPALVKNITSPLGIHTHNDFGMAAANSLAAAAVGFKYIDCTIGGIGERAGNCDYLKCMKGLEGLYHFKSKVSRETITEILGEITGIITGKNPRLLKRVG
ncbi:MAG: homocitrate synthase [Peptococcaceae bacterium]